MSSSKSVAASSTCKIRSICILGGTSIGKDSIFRNAAYDLGKALAAKKIHIVYSGGIDGLKGCTVGTAINRGSKILGISLMEGLDHSTFNLTFGTTQRVSTMQERMAQMLYNSDAFIALPGGLETIEDILTVLSWANLNYHQKPLGFFNTNGFYNGLLSFVEQGMDQGFIPKGIEKLMVHSPHANDLLQQLQNLHTSKEKEKEKEKKEEKKDKDRKRKEPDTTLRL